MVTAKKTIATGRRAESPLTPDWYPIKGVNRLYAEEVQLSLTLIISAYSRIPFFEYQPYVFFDLSSQFIRRSLISCGHKLI